MAPGQRSDAFVRELAERQTARLGRYQEGVKRALEDLASRGFASRLWAKEPALWKKNEKDQKIIKERLGWLASIDAMAAEIDPILDFADDARRAGFTHAILLGMGGSSLCAEVMLAAYGVSSGYLDLRILDSTDPATILHIEESVPLRQTLFIVASKSGTTTEAVAFYHYFFSKIKGTRGNDSGDQFIAITDPGSPLEKIAREQAFRRTFLNFSDIGGRYSALSYFGLVPGALIGVNIRELLERAKCMALACGPDLPVERNPGLHLGGVLGGLAKAGRDKITFILSPALSPFGAWTEQLLSESTGKEGRGLIPVVDEALGAPRVYGDDRVFVHIGFSPDQAEEARLKAVEEAGHPVVGIVLKDALDLGAEFFRWEIATAVAGAILAINPFDEPNVQESKDNTNQLLKEFSARGSLPHDGAFAQEGGVTLYGDQKTSAKAKQSGDGLKGFLAAYLRQAQPGDYVALLVYLEPSTRRGGLLREIRRRLRDGLRLATTLGYGPRYLHSTEQLHKRGAKYRLVHSDHCRPGEGS